MLPFQTIISIDTVLFHWFQGRRKMHIGVAKTSRFISRIGDGFLYVSIAVLLACFEPQSGVGFLLTCLFAFTLELPIYILLKNTIRRDRPCDRLGLEAVIKPSDKFSFPSGHTAFAFVFFSLLSETYPAVALMSYSIATLVGLSRIFLGVHYPADILAGAALGVICTDVSVRFLGI